LPACKRIARLSGDGEREGSARHHVFSAFEIQSLVRLCFENCFQLAFIAFRQTCFRAPKDDSQGLFGGKAGGNFAGITADGKVNRFS